MAVRQIDGGDWQTSLCDCAPCGSCIMGTFAPCLLVGRTASRLRNPSDPSPEYMNGDCMIHFGLSLFASGWIFSMIQRGEVRQRFGIPGSGCGDCCTAFWCQCCQVIQSDSEVNARLVHTGPISQGYEAPKEQMTVPQYQQYQQHQQ